jgi:hypothetical protein
MQLQYRIIDLQGEGTHGDEVFNSKEEIREHLINYHSVDYTGETPIEEFTLPQILDYGDWNIEEIKRSAIINK